MKSPSAKPLRIATRKSQLALWQAEHVAGLLRRAHTGLEIELVPMVTQGDRIQDRSLAAIGDVLDIGGVLMWAWRETARTSAGRSTICPHRRSPG